MGKVEGLGKNFNFNLSLFEALFQKVVDFPKRKIFTTTNRRYAATNTAGKSITILLFPFHFPYHIKKKSAATYLSTADCEISSSPSWT
ncbi:MAG: hypothetical protein LBB85_04705 [Dysgonamonadaceae bacterium]|nr:hypothetical protein [Dysgonamonadaceae bacterium]